MYILSGDLEMIGWRGAFRTLPLTGLLALILLVTPGVLAGVWAWPAAWVFLAVFGAGSALGSGLLAVLRPESFRVRQQGYVAPRESGQPLIDAVACRSTSCSSWAGTRSFRWTYFG